MTESQKPKEVDNAYKFETKFNIGDWIVATGKLIYKVIEIREQKFRESYILIDTDNNEYEFGIQSIECDGRLWTIQDAEDGDVLAVEATEDNQCPFVAIYNYRGLDFFNSYCCIGFDGSFSVGDTGHFILNVHPATKEQRELLFQAMEERDYKWDANNKRLIYLL